MPHVPCAKALHANYLTQVPSLTLERDRGPTPRLAAGPRSPLPRSIPTARRANPEASPVPRCSARVKSGSGALTRWKVDQASIRAGVASGFRARTDWQTIGQSEEEPRGRHSRECYLAGPVASAGPMPGWKALQLEHTKRPDEDWSPVPASPDPNHAHEEENRENDRSLQKLMKKTSANSPSPSSSATRPSN